MSTRIGTSYFVSTPAAMRYYKSYGFNRAHVLRKLADGEIHIGLPPLKRGESYMLDAVEGRYTIVSETPPPPPVQKPAARNAYVAYKNYVMRKIDKGPGRCGDQLIATLKVQGRGGAQAYRDARLFAAARMLLEACRVALPAAEDADDDELAALLRAAIDAAGEQK